MNVLKMVSAVWSILSARQKVASIGLLGLMFVSMILEMLGVGLMIPALAAMTLDDSTPSPVAAAILARLGNPTKQQLIVGAFSRCLSSIWSKRVFLLSRSIFNRGSSPPSRPASRGNCSRSTFISRGRSTSDATLLN